MTDPTPTPLDDIAQATQLLNEAEQQLQRGIPLPGTPIVDTLSALARATYAATHAQTITARLSLASHITDRRLRPRPVWAFLLKGQLLTNNGRLIISHDREQMKREFPNWETVEIPAETITVDEWIAPPVESR